MALDFLIKTKGLEVSVSTLTKVPADLVPVWDFGVDNSQVSDGTTATYTYETSGRYLITLNLENAQQEVVETVSKSVMVSEYARTQLTDSIYNLIDNFIPEDLRILFEPGDKAAFITKWQLYIQPLVNHCIPLDEYNNESYYEGLENQLVMELAAYDFLFIRIENMLMQTAAQLERYNTDIEVTEGEGSGGNRDRIKQITTGPTEVQYYDTITESISALFKAYAQATNPGGVLDNLRQNLCMLASRLDIIIPFCTNPRRIVVPRVVNHRHAGILGGPNPGSPILKPVGSILP